MIIYILENDEVAKSDIPREKLMNSFGNDIEFQSVKEIEDIPDIDKGAIYVSSLQNLGETKQDIMDALDLISEKDIRIIVGDIPDTLALRPNITKIMTALYKTLAYKDYQKRVINQQRKINEMKKDEEKWKSYGRNQKLTMEEFTSVYQSILQGELSVKEAQERMGISKRTFYVYKNKYEKGI
ncbi:hypothetical protein SAMN02746066_04342 [Anaerosporobacter mobilis DSM 15930]|jgi:DNA invertase Pin-like site-specific DNA recombinase|uniref:Site-specific DNA recombinase n=1 Tax=Anaerosporobacter mobilis DSM 15930 TaxID=1120996 RepID=A0A1M7NAT2_9FIRM|nr:helix-turn-helix domain-containing protein [Anaerosporobacter mobilis]SHN00624.1 hypothetical protein SAMN02746066_04342 [Anaerosporobacter mobilis DSM 15930]